MISNRAALATPHVALALLLGSWPTAARPEAAQEKGLVLKSLGSPEPGKVRAFVEVLPTLTLDPRRDSNDFRLVLSGGAAANVNVHRNGDAGGMTTIYLVDVSPSYKTHYGRRVAFPTIRADAQFNIPFPPDQAALFTFAGELHQAGFFDEQSSFLKEITRVEASKAEKHTNLIGAVRDTLEKARKPMPGLVDVVLFTDAGDEASTPDAPGEWEQIITAATQSGVRFIVITSSTKHAPAGFDDHADLWLSTRNTLERLAKATGGEFLPSTTDVVQLARQLGARREAARQWLVLEGQLCGVPTTGEVQAKVEYAPRGGPVLASTRFADLRSPHNARNAQPCPGSAPACGTCREWEVCDPASSRCSGKKCSSAEPCAASATCGADGICSAPPKSWWLWAAGALGIALMGISVLMWLRWRMASQAPRARTVVEHGLASPGAPLPQPPLMAPPVALPPAAQEPPLPDIQLVVETGPPAIGKELRLRKRKTQVGASADPADGNDIVVAEPKVSSRHALFELFPSGDLWLTDLGSTNGTFVDGKKLASSERVKLAIGAQIRLSNQVILRVVRPGAAPIAAGPEKAAAPPAPKNKTVFDPGNR